MASIVYDKGLTELEEGGSIDYANDNIKVMLVTSSYIPDAAAHESLADISGEVSGSGYTAGGRILGGRGTSGSEPTFYLADDSVWPLLSVIDLRYAVVYKDSGEPGSSWLIACIDFGEEYDLVGQDLVIAWVSGVVMYSGLSGSDIVTSSIAANGDDGSSTASGFYENLVRIGKQSTSTDVFARFLNVEVPQGSEVLAAKITFRADSSTTGLVTRCNIFCNDEDNAAAPTNRTDHENKSRTSEYVAWDGIIPWIDGSDYDSPDISDVVQEVIDRPGWESGHALMVLIDDDGSDGGSQRIAYDYSSSVDHCAMLSVTYSTVVAGVEPPLVSFYDTRIRLRARKRRTLLTTKVRNIL